MGFAAIHAPLLPTPNIPPSALLSDRQPAAQFGCNRGRSHGSWRHQQFHHRGLAILVPGLTFIASIALPAMTTDTATGREIGSAVGDPIPAASYVKPSDILLLSAPNFSNVVMDNSIVLIWHCIILQVLLNGFRTPVQINTSHLTLQP
jgi:hypothetical protein